MWEFHIAVLSIVQIGIVFILHRNTYGVQQNTWSKIKYRRAPVMEAFSSILCYICVFGMTIANT